MPPTKKVQYRLAARIYANMRLTHESESIQELLRDLVVCTRKLEVAKVRKHRAIRENCPTARQKYLDDELYALISLRNLLHADRNMISEELEKINDFVPMTLRNIMKDFDGLENEFGDWKYDHEHGRIIVNTNDISFEHVDLGPFAMCLYVEDMRYRIEALEPNLSHEEEYPHPHVGGTSLCPGRHRSEISHLLNTGQIFEFFLKINTILHNYRPNGAYCRIENWDGDESMTCPSCNERTEEGYGCANCGDSFCENCTTCCDDCADGICMECSISCRNCDNYFCTSCVHKCRKCREYFCHECLSRCEDCDHDFCRNCTKHCVDCNSVICNGCFNSDTPICAQCTEAQEAQEQENSNEHTEDEDEDEDES